MAQPSHRSCMYSFGRLWTFPPVVQAHISAALAGAKQNENRRKSTKIQMLLFRKKLEQDHTIAWRCKPVCRTSYHLKDVHATGTVDLPKQLDLLWENLQVRPKVICNKVNKKPQVRRHWHRGFAAAPQNLTIMVDACLAGHL